MSTTVDKDDAHRIINLMAEIVSKMNDREKENLMSWCQGLSCKITWQHDKQQPEERR